ncbi:GNAT family N-acetyltransferase [Stutzerimonas azotifigens]|uniref:GNAT family N-acetyltransferase n=1 Tax=Stutzerimonas azotifigens TaxID=291995 RepID=UPI00041A19D3|nr:GNAT family N-acetyltransferase [Stutzerimonas azotifigens]
MTECTTYYLEMTRSDQARAKPLPAELDVVEIEIRQYPFNRFLYQLVGGPWQWTDKLALPDEAWRAQIESPDHRTWVAYHRGAIAGYYELQRSGPDVEILYFGLVEQFFGRGFGGPLLGHALGSAWAWPGTERIWVHTCTLDHPSALANYQARGMRIYREETTAA